MFLNGLGVNTEYLLHCTVFHSYMHAKSSGWTVVSKTEETTESIEPILTTTPLIMVCFRRLLSAF